MEAPVGTRFSADYIRQQPEYQHVVRQGQSPLIQTCLEDGQVKLKFGNSAGPVLRAPPVRRQPSAQSVSHTSAYFLTASAGTPPSSAPLAARLGGSRHAAPVPSLGPPTVGVARLGHAVQNQNSAFPSQAVPPAANTNLKQIKDQGLRGQGTKRTEVSSVQLGKVQVEKPEPFNYIHELFSGERSEEELRQEDKRNFDFVSSSKKQTLICLSETNGVHSHEKRSTANDENRSQAMDENRSQANETKICDTVSGFLKQTDATGQSNVIYRRLQPTGSTKATQPLTEVVGHILAIANEADLSAPASIASETDAVLDELHHSQKNKLSQLAQASTSSIRKSPRTLRTKTSLIPSSRNAQPSLGSDLKRDQVKSVLRSSEIEKQRKRCNVLFSTRLGTQGKFNGRENSKNSQKGKDASHCMKMNKVEKSYVENKFEDTDEKTMHTTPEERKNTTTLGPEFRGHSATISLLQDADPSSEYDNEDLDGESHSGTTTPVIRVDIRKCRPLSATNTTKPGKGISEDDILLVEEDSVPDDASEFSDDVDVVNVDGDEYLTLVHQLQQDKSSMIVTLAAVPHRLRQQRRQRADRFLGVSYDSRLMDQSVPAAKLTPRGAMIRPGLDTRVRRYSTPAALQSAGLRTALVPSTYIMEFRGNLITLTEQTAALDSSDKAVRVRSPLKAAVSRRGSLKSVLTPGVKASTPGSQLQSVARQVSWAGHNLMAASLAALGRRHSSFVPTGPSAQKRQTVVEKASEVQSPSVSRRQSDSRSQEGLDASPEWSRRMSAASALSDSRQSSRRASRVDSTAADMPPQTNKKYDPKFEKSEKFNHQRENAFNKASQWLTPVRPGLRNLQVHYSKTTTNHNDGLIFAHLLRAAHVKNAAFEENVYEMERRLYTRRHTAAPHATTFYDVQGRAPKSRGNSPGLSSSSKGYSTVAKRKKERRERIQQKNEQLVRGYTPRALSLRELGPEDIGTLRQQCRYLRISPAMQQHLYDADADPNFQHEVVQ